MSRSNENRLDDITNAIAAIRSHLERGPISDNLVMDAVAMRLLELGEAVKGPDHELTATKPNAGRWIKTAVPQLNSQAYLRTRIANGPV